MKSKKVAYFGIFIALAFIFSYIETLIPITIPIQGVKLGLANIVIVISLYKLKWKETCLLSIVRVLLVSVTFGNLYSLLYSIAGGILSLFGMIIAKRTDRFSIIGVSIIGGVFHNIGQLLVAIFVVKTIYLLYYIPVLIIAGVITGALIGVISIKVIPKLSRVD